MYINGILLFTFIVIIIGISSRKKSSKTTEDVIEGITNMNCCGGISPGVHYKESDTKPPVFVRRCFKSSDEGGETVYQWNGFPCSSKESSECCDGGATYGVGECIATTRGGYCRQNDSSGGTSNRNFVFQRKSDKAKAFIKRGNDRILDVNDAVDMEDYFFALEENEDEEEMSPQMREYLERSKINRKYVQSHVVDRAREKLIQDTSKHNLLTETKESNQIKISITLIHILLLLTFAIVIKELIIQRIDNFYSLIDLKYMEFTGKTV